MTQAFIDEVVHFAETTTRPQLLPIIDRVRRPVRIAVVGRRGVGRGSVETALRHRGVVVVPVAACEVCVLVIADTAKPEDRLFVRSVGRPVLIVLTKADLAGAGPDGPLAVARGRARAVRLLTGVPTVPAVGLLAALGSEALDGDLVAALRVFIAEPPDLTSVDAFVGAPHRVTPDLRGRLIERLDRFGIAHAILLLAGGADPAQLPERLAALSNVEEVMFALTWASVPVRHRRMRTAVAEMRSLAAQLDDVELFGLVADDAVVLAVMTAAVDVLEADGLSVDRGDTPAAHLDRAIRWRRYGRGPVNALHRRCSGDVVRGSLRLLGAVSA